jgi:hypothetical protein
MEPTPEPELEPVDSLEIQPLSDPEPLPEFEPENESELDPVVELGTPIVKTEEDDAVMNDSDDVSTAQKYITGILICRCNM